MRIKYLGTAAAEGIPGIFCKCDLCEEVRKLKGKDIRTRSQSIIDDFLLIDFPPDTYMHVLQYNINMPDISNILITHSHQDHFYPEEFLFLSKGFCENETGKINVYGNDKVIKQANKYLMRLSEDEKNKHFHLTKLDKYKQFNIKDYLVTPLLANHDKSEECLIYIIEKDDKCLLYGNDTGIFPAETWNYIKGKYFDLVSLDCTMGKLKEGSNHMGIPDNLETVERLKNLGCIDNNSKIIVTHFSHNGGLLHSEIEHILKPYNIQVAYDGLDLLI